MEATERAGGEMRVANEARRDDLPDDVPGGERLVGESEREDARGCGVAEGDMEVEGCEEAAAAEPTGVKWTWRPIWAARA